MSCSESGAFALQVVGDSMMPEFRDGAIVIVEPGAMVEDRCFVVAEDHEEHVLRQLKIIPGGWELVTLNGNEKPLRVDTLESIKGRVIQRGGRRRSEHKWYV